MNRTRALETRHSRILGAGIVLSAVAHAVLFASLRFSAPAVDRGPAAAPGFVPPEPETAVWKAALRVIETAPAPAALEPLSFDAAGDAGAGAAPPPPPAAAPAGGMDAPVLPSGAVAFQKVTVLDPFTNGLVTPISFGDLPEAEFTLGADPDADDDIAIHVPGSVGQAKRNWAKGSGAGAGRDGSGPGIRIGLVGNGGGHCPMPGQGGRPLPPVRKLAE